MDTRKGLTSFGLLAILSICEAADGVPRIQPAVMIYEPGVTTAGPVYQTVATPVRRRRRARRRVVSVRSKKKSAVIIGGTAATGAAIGALAGGGKGAGIGALAGGGAGVVYDQATRKKTVKE